MTGKLVDWGVIKRRVKSLHLADFINLRSVGYTLQRAWVFSLFLNVGVSLCTATGDQVPESVYFMSTISLVVTLFAAAASPNAFSRALTHDVRRWTGPALTSIGTCLTFVLCVDGTPTDIITIVAGLLMGFGSGIICLGYGEVYRNVPLDRAGYEIPCATLLAAAIYAAQSFLSPSASMVLLAALPLASGYILLITHKVWSPAHIRKVLPVQIDVKQFAWRIGSAACIIGAADGLARRLYIYTNDVPMDSFHQPGMFFSCIIVFVLLVGYRLIARKRTYRSMYQFVTFAMAFVFMLIPVFTSSGVLENTLMQTSYNCFNVLIWLLLAALAYNYRLSAMVVFGIGWGMVSLGVLLGQVVALGIIEVVGTFSHQQISLTVLVITTITLASYMFVLPERKMEDITQARRDSLVPSESASVNQAERESAHQVAVPFDERCAMVARRYRLTPRETEVMILYARGRSGPRIQEELVLSRGTVATHLQHIYQKMGIHSKQELLDIIEGDET